MSKDDGGVFETYQWIQHQHVINQYKLQAGVVKSKSKAPLDLSCFSKKHTDVIMGDNKKEVPNKVIITGYEQSSLIFGNKAKKQALVEAGAVCPVQKFEPNFLCKKDGIIRDTYVLETPFETFRFVASEVKPVQQIVKTPPKDRTIKTGVEVRIVNNRDNGLSKTDRFKVTSIVRDLSHEDRTRDIAIISHNDKTCKIFIKHLKRV